MKPNDITESFEKLKRKETELGQKTFKSVCDYIFAAYPQINNIAFTGWTPYFSDGDASHFSVNIDSMSINGISEYEYDNEDEEGGISNKERESLISILKHIKPLLSAIPDRVYEEMFGEEFTVTAKKDGSVETGDAPSHD